MKSKSIASNDEAKNQNVSFQFFSNSKEDLNKTLNARNSDAVQIKEAYFKRGDNAYLDEISWTPGIHLLDKDNRKIEINIQKVEPKRYKTLKEVRGEVIKGYQEELEKAYRAELAQRFPNISLSDFEIKQLWNK